MSSCNLLGIPEFTSLPDYSEGRGRLSNLNTSHYGSTGCRVFKRGVPNLKDFRLKINILKGDYRILRIGVVGRCKKVRKFDFQLSQFSMSKIKSFSMFFSLKNTDLGAHYLLLNFF